jgi:hypothetical protein
MDVGIGLPNAVPGTEGRTLVDWARRADEAGFSTLSTIGRLVYPNDEELGDIAGQIAASAAVSPGDGEGLRRRVRGGRLRRAHLRAGLVEPGAGRAAR